MIIAAKDNEFHKVNSLTRATSIIRHGIKCQFCQEDDILSNAKLRINETPNDRNLGEK